MGGLELDAVDAENSVVQIWRMLPLEGTRLEDLRQGDLAVPFPDLSPLPPGAVSYTHLTLPTKA